MICRLPDTPLDRHPSNSSAQSEFNRQVRHAELVDVDVTVRGTVGKGFRRTGLEMRMGTFDRCTEGAGLLETQRMEG